MSLNEFIHKIEKTDEDGNTLSVNNYGIHNIFFRSPIIYDDVSFTHVMKIDPESQPDADNESEYCSRVNNEENSICIPIIYNFDKIANKKCIHYSLKDNIYVKRNEKDIIDIFNRTLTEILNLKTAVEICNNVFSTDTTGMTPMSSISSTLTPKLQEISTNLDNIIKDYEDFYK